MTTLIIKLLVPNEVIYPTTGFNSKTEESFTHFINNPTLIKFPNFASLFSKYEGQEDVRFVAFTMDSSEYREEKKDLTEQEYLSLTSLDTTRWEDYLEFFSYKKGFTLTTERIQFMGRCHAWNDLSMSEEVDHRLNMTLSTYDSLSKVIVDFSTSNPMSLHFYLWGLKQKLRGLNVEFIQVDKGVVIVQEDYWQHWESTFQLMNS